MCLTNSVCPFLVERAILYRVHVVGGFSKCKDAELVEIVEQILEAHVGREGEMGATREHGNPRIYSASGMQAKPPLDNKVLEQ